MLMTFLVALFLSLWFEKQSKDKFPGNEPLSFWDRFAWEGLHGGKYAIVFPVSAIRVFPRIDFGGFCQTVFNVR